MIKEQVTGILQKLPKGVQLVGAAKTRTPQEILEAIEGGLKIVGENYVQEAEQAFEVIGHKVQWHMIGHLQTNKVKKAVKVFDMIQTLASLKLAEELQRCCERIGSTMPVLIEINSGEESQKSGVLPADAISLHKEVSLLERVRIMGLMTMGPFSLDPEDSRLPFRRTKQIFDTLQEMSIPRVEMKYLSMGMSSSYQVAIDEGANMVRIGTKLFGERLQSR
jgi:pyridoxal phosphate enzyme (YggS family)